ncbi:MAG: hypothetical protein ACLTBV_28630 [Enterocloster bolteae]
MEHDDTKVSSQYPGYDAKGADGLSVRGRMSVDPDDKTPLAIR